MKKEDIQKYGKGLGKAILEIVLTRPRNGIITPEEVDDIIDEYANYLLTEEVKLSTEEEKKEIFAIIRKTVYEGVFKRS